MAKVKLFSFCDLAKERGARDALIIPTTTVVTAPWVRMKCQFGCDGYGDRLTCPPYSPTPEQTRQILDSYQKALLIHGDEWTDIRKIVVELEREIFLAGYYKAYAMGSGPCNLCSTCNVKRPCVNPDARPAMEACGIDVFQTVRNHGLPIEVLTSTACKPNYYGLVLIE